MYILKKAFALIRKVEQLFEDFAVRGYEKTVGGFTVFLNLLEEVVEKVGGIDLFVSNAGVLKAGSVKTMEVKDFKFVTDVNYIGFGEPPKPEFQDVYTTKIYTF